MHEFCEDQVTTRKILSSGCHVSHKKTRAVAGAVTVAEQGVASTGGFRVASHLSGYV
jgi:hypothetical protein